MKGLKWFVVSGCKISLWLATLAVFSLGGTCVFAQNPGYSDDPGTLAPYDQPDLTDGAGKKLLAIYIVGSDLEFQGDELQGAASSDLDELVAGYNALSEAEKNTLDVVVAFGGCEEPGWVGMKFANISQIVQDSEDKHDDGITGKYGNETSDGAYLYTEDRAHMGDESSLKLFLDYLKDGYRNHETKFLILWDHGGSYDGCCNDTNFSDDGLSLTEIGNGLAKNSADMGQFDIIGFDQCLMGSAEVAKITKPYSGYQLSSEELEPGYGWNYTPVIREYAQKGVVDAGKAIIDDFVSGDTDEKTLSLLDLSKFDAMVSALDPVATVFAENIASDKDFSDSVIFAAANTQEYGGQKDERVSIDLKHFFQNVAKKLSDSDTGEKISTLISAIDEFVVYARDDGSKPNSFGVSIAPPDKSAGGYEVSPAWISFQQAYTDLKDGDTTPPDVDDVDNDGDADQQDFDMASEFEWLEYDADWKGYWEWINDENRDWQTYNNLLQNDSYKEDWEAYLKDCLSDPAMKTYLTSLLKNDPDWTAYIASLASGEAGTTTGITATFTDDNLAKVTTVFGFQDGDEFMSVAEVEAYPTTTPGKYFTPDWDRKWYCVKYDPSADTEWMPMTFQERFVRDREEYTTYSAEIDYYESGATEEPEWAVLNITVNADNAVTDYAVRTYKILYSGADDEEGRVLFDKETKKIKSGNRIQFLTYAYNMTDPKNDVWLETSDIITFAQEPEFTLELLEFEDENGALLDYKYSMVGEDINGNRVMTPPESVRSAEFRLSDAINALKVLVGDTSISNSPDANGDDKIGFEDVIIILRMLANPG